MARCGSLSGRPSTSYIITLLAMAGKIAPSPSSPLSRSPTQATAASMARWRVRFGNNGSVARKTLSTPRKNQNHDAFCCGAFGVGPSVAGGSTNSSSMRTPLALRARGRFAISTNSGTMTVRLQYEILSRWNGNHFGSSMISTGIIGTARHGMKPNRASMMRVNTLARSAPPRASIASRARRM